jgi:hypothetical protein
MRSSHSSSETSSSETSSNVNADKLQCYKETLHNLTTSEAAYQVFHESKRFEPIDLSDTRILLHVESIMENPFHTTKSIEFLKELR